MIFVENKINGNKSRDVTKSRDFITTFLNKNPLQ